MDEENKELAPSEEETRELVPLGEEKKEYVINILGGGKNREIRLSEGVFKFGVASFFLGLIIFIGACGYSIYSALNVQRNAAIVREVQQASELQQEQILTISKKAETLSETLRNLTQQEQELRIQAGLNPPKEDKTETPAEGEQVTTEGEQVSTEGEQVPTESTTAESATQTENSAQVQEAVQEAENAPAEEPSAEHNGQGGPIENLTVENVAEALAMLEQRVNTRKESLDDFQTELKQKREQMAVAAASATSAAGSVPVPNYTGTWSPSTVSSYDLSQFGGNPAADSHMPSIWPTTGVVTSPYGLRWGGSDFHPGMDIANDMGTPIVATADGIVDYAGWNAGGYGNMVDIDHGNGIMTRYGHASQVVVSTGQFVQRGQVIALMGSTGFSTGPHVHYEVIINGQRVNPISYL